MPVGQMTGAEFLEMIRNGTFCEESHENTSGEKRYLFGLAGICRRFGVSHATAQRLKDGILAPAVRQCGRKIIVDEALAVQLFGGK
jgi:hypothetical protein